MQIPDTLKDLVFEVQDLLSPAQCNAMISKAERHGFDAASIRSEVGTEIRADIRNNDRLFMDDPELAEALWTRLYARFSRPFKDASAIGLNTRFRIYRYRPGQFFDWHQDGTFRPDENQESRFTLLIYLNDNFAGGGTSFADVFSPHVFRDFTIAPKTGKALVFHHPLSHRGEAVQVGQKYVLRSDVMFSLPN